MHDIDTAAPVVCIVAFGRAEAPTNSRVQLHSLTISGDRAPVTVYWPACLHGGPVTWTLPTGAVWDIHLAGGGVLHADTRVMFHPADLNHDGVVDSEDQRIFMDWFDAGAPDADFDGDGGVTLDDLLAYMREYCEATP